MRKILYSPGYGGGWSSWHQMPPKFACEYQPIIDALEKGEELVLNKDATKWKLELEDYHPAVRQYVQDCKEKYNVTPYLGGIEDLCIFTCGDDELVKIREYDGAERVEVGFTDFF